MNRNVKILHRIFFALNIVMLAGSLVFYLIRWNSLPAEIGVHFDPDGNFDVTESKFYGFYPHVIGSIIIIGSAIAGDIIEKKKTGLKLSEKGESLFRAELLLTLDCFEMIWSIFFMMWSLSVSLQEPLNKDILAYSELADMLLVTAGIIIQIVTCRRYRDKSSAGKDAGQVHRLCRLIAWLVTAGGILMLAESWVRYPGDPELYLNADYYGLAYFANFDAFLDKRLLIIPHAAVIMLLAVLEVISVRAVRAENTALAGLADRLKVIGALFFFWWNIVLESELPVGIVSAVIFALLYAVSFVIFVLEKKRDLSLPHS